MKTKARKVWSLIIALIVAGLMTVGYIFAWLVDRLESDLRLKGLSEGAYFDSGNGSEETPFVIANPTHMHNLAVLQNMGRFVDENGNPKKYYFEIKKTVDTINMSDSDYEYIPPIGNDTNPFIGDFNGNGKTIANFTVTTDKEKLKTGFPLHAAADYEFSNAVGLFGMTGEESNIHNVILETPKVEVASTNTKYSDGANTVVGLAVGHVAGMCQSVGVRTTSTTALDVKRVVTGTDKGYSTFNSILGELASNVMTSVTGSAGALGSGGSGNAFGASFDVESLSKRLFDIYEGKYGKKYEKNANERALENLLPLIDTKNDIPVPALGYKVPFTVDYKKSIYGGAEAREIAANNNVGYVMGNQNKISTKTLKFASNEPSINSMIKGNDGVYTMPDGTAPTNNNMPRWFYTQNGGWNNSHYQSGGVFGFEPISQAKYDGLPDNIKNLLVTESKNQRTYTVMRMQSEFNEYSTAPINSNALDAFAWGYHGQISWMGKIYGEGIADVDGNAVNTAGYNFTSDGYLLDDKDYMFVLENGQKFYVAQDENWNGVAHSVEYIITKTDNTTVITAVALTDGGVYFGRYRASSEDEYIYGYLDENGYFYNEDGFIVAEDIDGVVASVTSEGYAMAPDGKYYGKYTDWSSGSGITYLCDLSEYGYVLGDDGYLVPSSSGISVKSDKTDSEGRIVNANGELYRYYQYGWPNGVVAVDSDGYFKSDDGTYYADFSNSWPINSYKIDEEGYYIVSDGERYLDGNGNPLRAYGYYKAQAGDGSYYLADENGNEVTFTDQYNNTKTLTLASSANANGGVYLTAKKGDYITAKKGENIYVKQGTPVPLYSYENGVVLPNNGLWFKPSQAGKMRFVMFAQTDDESFSLLKCTRTNATAANPFNTTGNKDITVEKVIQQRLPVYALFYYEFDVKAEEVYNTEYLIVIDNNVKGNGAYFLYLDIGSSAAETEADTFLVDETKVSAVDFIYEGVKIEQDATSDLGLGNFIVASGAEMVLYNPSKTIVFFKNIQAALQLAFTRLNHDEDVGSQEKTIKLNDGITVDSNVMATYPDYVIPGGITKGTLDGVSGGTGGGTTNPVTPTVSSVTITGAPSAAMQVNDTVTLSASVNMSDSSTYSGTVSWTSSDTSVAEVSSSGVVTAKAAGTATITATAGGKSKTCTITVTGGATQYHSGTYTLNAESTDSMVTNNGATETGSSWTFGGNAQTVNLALNVQEGKVITISVKGRRNSDKAEGINVYLGESNSGTKLGTIDLTSTEGEGIGTVQYTATADGYVYLALGRSAAGGTILSEITVTISDGGSVTPTPTVSSVTITGAPSAAMQVNDTVTLSASVNMSDSSTYSGTVSWTSSDTSVAEVSSSGVVTAKAAGTATITATAGGKEATCTITVTGGEVGGTVSEFVTGDAKFTANSKILSLIDGGTEIASITATADSGNPNSTSGTVKDENGETITCKRVQTNASFNLELKEGYKYTIYIVSASSGSSARNYTLKQGDTTVATAQSGGKDTYTLATMSDIQPVAGATDYVLSLDGNANIARIAIYAEKI